MLRGTPNSTTTSLSELSTVAIKDGHRGHFPHHHHPAEAERAERISRLAGLERVSMSNRTMQGLAPGAASNPPPGYFDANNQPQMFRERSTVGSASATGSVGGRTTWASGSDVNDPDRMSEDQDNETSSMGGFSDAAASLAGTAEGAATPSRQHSQVGSPAVSRAAAVPQYLRDQQQQGSPATSSSPATTTTSSSAEQQKQEAKMIDAMTYDEGVIDTADRTPPLTGPGPGQEQTSEQIIQETLRQRQQQGIGQSQSPMDVDRGA
jgi:hypothetical protein